MSAVLEAVAVRKTYRGGDGSILEVLNHIDLALLRGEITAIVGASGSGKSTLLNLLGLLDQPTSGTISLEGKDLSGIEERERCKIRNQTIGFVFQFHHLLREFSAVENVMMPLLIGGVDEKQARSRAEELLASVGLAGRMLHRPAELSGGEQQRCAVARGMVSDPRLVLADEPTGNLDYHNSVVVGDLFFKLARELETTVVVVTHNKGVAERADRVLKLEGGRLVSATAEEMFL